MPARMTEGIKPLHAASRRKKLRQQDARCRGEPTRYDRVALVHARLRRSCLRVVVKVSKRKSLCRRGWGPVPQRHAENATGYPPAPVKLSCAFLRHRLEAVGKLPGKAFS